MPNAIAGAIGIALFEAGATAAATAVVTFGATALAASLTATAVSLGLQLVSGALLRGGTRLPTPSDGQVAIRQPLSPRVRGYGTLRVSGTVFWLDAKTDTLYLGFAINHGRIGGIVSWLIDSNVVDIDGTDKVTTSPYSATNVFLHHRLGLPTQTKYSELLTAFGADQMRGDGIATILATIQNPASAATFQNDYPSNPPRVRVTADLSVVWDPRDATQVRTDATTWQWSENPVVCLLDYLLSADGFGMAFERIQNSLTDWVTAANVCDELVPLLAGGFTKRYRLAGQYRFSDDPAEVVAKFCSTFDGRVWPRRDGSIGVIAGKFVPPGVTLTEADIAGWPDLMRGQDPVKAIEGIRAQFMSPDYDYREHEAEPWPSGDAVLALSSDRTATLDLLWVPSLAQARRLMKRAYIRAKSNWRGTIVTNLAGLRAVDERFVRLQIAELGIDDTFEINRLTLDPAALTCALDVVQIDASIDDWDASEEGTGEGAVFGLVSTYTKSGTTIDPIAEVGATIGQTVYIFAANNTGTPATPAGYAAVGVVGGGPPFTAVYRRVIDGTETAVSVNSAAGGILVHVFNGMPSPTETNYFGDISADTGTARDQPVSTTPYAEIAFAAANSDFTDSSYLLAVVNGTKAAIVGERFTEYRQGTVTLQSRVMVYGTDAVPDDIEVVLNADHGTNVKQIFEAFPGT